MEPGANEVIKSTVGCVINEAGETRGAIHLFLDDGRILIITGAIEVMVGTVAPYSLQ